MAYGIAKRGFGRAMMKKGGYLQSPVINSVKPKPTKPKPKPKVVKPRDINKNGTIDGFEKARAKGMAKGMGATFKAKSGGRAGYKAGRRVGGGKSMGNLPTPIRLSLVNQKKEKLKKG